MTSQGVERQPARERGTELEVLTSMLDHYRATVVLKVQGLTEEQARRRPVPASDLTVIGLVRHLAATERWWFPLDFAALDIEPLYPDGDPDGGFTPAAGDTLGSVVALYEAECERSRAAIAGHEPDAVARGEGMDFSLRYALVHMIEETARHCGHLDLLVETIDGRRGA